jgi:hypothetical protein
MGAIRVRRNVRPARRNRPAKDDPEHGAMTWNRWALAGGGLVALLLGLVAFMTLGTPVLLYMADLGADALLAVIMALTPP